MTERTFDLCPTNKMSAVEQSPFAIHRRAKGEISHAVTFQFLFLHVRSIDYVLPEILPLYGRIIIEPTDNNVYPFLRPDTQ